jgi:sigma-B regulation protein RsbU (phosphoserine phosphatase)
MSVALENARLWEQEELYRKSLEREFEIGRNIQASFLPDSLPQPEGWEIAAMLKPAREVSGDFYDVFKLMEGKIGLVVADVCDKGLGAALFMILFRSLLRAVSNIDFYTNSDYSGAVSVENRLINAFSLTNSYIVETHGKTSMFCTIFFGVLDTSTGKLTYVNAGHLPPKIISPQGVKETLIVTSPAVGTMPGVEFSARDITIEAEDIFFAHTDGLTDAVNSSGKYFNEEELLPLFAEAQPLALLVEKINEHVKDYSAGGKQNDDITILVVRRKK